jgi:oligoendopeptidase F
VEEVVVPAARRLAERRRRQLKVDSLRPWDLHVDPTGRPPLRPFGTIAELTDGLSAVFHQVDPALGASFDLLRAEDLLDLGVRANKAPVGYCLPFNAARRPFIFLHCAGSHDDVTSLLHEGGHAFHVLAMAHLPYLPQRDIELMSAEFGEVGSMAMEYLALPSLGVFYDEAGVARATAKQLEGDIRGWCWIALVDAFQHWVYEHPDLARDPDRCDATFQDLTLRYDAGVDYRGLEPFMRNGWQVVPHIHDTPFYYLEYGLALLGAVQIWMRAQQNQEDALRRYRSALSLGETRTVPELFDAAGARFAFDASILRTAVEAMEATIDRLQSPT